TPRIAGKHRSVGSNKMPALSLDEQRPRLPASATNKKIVEPIVVDIGDGQLRPACRFLVRDQILLLEIVKAIFLVPPAQLHLRTYVLQRHRSPRKPPIINKSRRRIPLPDYQRLIRGNLSKQLPFPTRP